jgi:pimeloyl-ACP methyl ester carboxylesterase
MLAELSAGIDWLETQVWMEPARIGVIGLSMGGTHAWWLGALDVRLRAVVSMCCLADLETLTRTGAHDGHGPYMTVPGLFAVARTSQIAGFCAPRAQLVCAGLQDWSTPEGAFDTALADLHAAYGDDLGVLETHVDPAVGHAESPAMRATVLDFLHRHLWN